jgi:hypothetical protein
MAKAIIAAIVSGEVTFYDLSHGKDFFRAELKGEIPEWLQQCERFLDDASAVAKDYSVTLTVPEVITNADHQNLIFLRKLHSGFSTSAGPFTLTLDKTAHAQQGQLATAAEGSFQILTPEFPEELVVFGKRIPTGPVQYVIPRARIRELDEYLDFLCKAPIGAAIVLGLEPIGEITVQRHVPDASSH